jgi:hypothetical protein
LQNESYPSGAVSQRRAGACEGDAGRIFMDPLCRGPLLWPLTYAFAGTTGAGNHNHVAGPGRRSTAGESESTKPENDSMNGSHVAPTPAPGRGVGWIMARLDSPYPRKTSLPVAGIALLAIVIIIGAFVLLQHQSVDVAFREYALKTRSVDISSLAYHPELYAGQAVHTQGKTGDVILTDAGKQVVLSLPRAAQGTGSGGTEILVLTGADVPPHSLVDVWGTFAGAPSLDGTGAQESLPVLRADYVKSAK